MCQRLSIPLCKVAFVTLCDLLLLFMLFQIHFQGSRNPILKKKLESLLSLCLTENDIYQSTVGLSTKNSKELHPIAFRIELDQIQNAR
jgi:hypothetical protein